MIKMKVKIFLYFILTACGAIFYSCGKQNVFADSVSLTDKQKAAQEIRNGSYDSAISLLQNYVTDNPTDYSARSMLANAYMLKAGVNTLSLIASVSNNTFTARNNFYAILNAFPAGTQTRLDEINTAIQMLGLIPTDSLTSDQKLQTVIANVALAFFTISMNCVDSSSGLLSSTQVASMSLSNANIIYNSLLSVQTTLNSLSVVADSSSGLGILLTIVNEITGTGGSTVAEQLATFLLLNA